MAVTTHTVTNQPPPLVGYNVFASDPVLTEGITRHVAAARLDEVREELDTLGRAAGSVQARQWGEQANTHPRSCTPMTATATASTRWSSTRPGTGCSATPSPPG